ncbi:MULTISPECIES: diaminopropionate ammonia-lyase [Nocardioides]|uniref:Diaminopropionate ammonia-lyase n=1 Tax=Nocardioides vastitatis TaxID=2568655 RepID=A0ABW0Z8Q6_9ACTN|nr:diaminopropionate ammonia-lyase [Nocardioides sp.]THJ02377.1 diaminopropionate ammonia-lyase [Nocardioides sp.]
MSPRVVRNPHLRRDLAAPEPDPAVRAFHESLPGYAPSPLVPASTVAERLGVAEVWVKDESTRLGMPAFKIMGASWATYRVLCERLELDPAAVGGLEGLRAALAAAGATITLVAATDGNHGRAVARMASLLGLPAHILVPHHMVPARIEALRSEGAHVTVVPGPYDEAVATSAQLAGPAHVVVSDTSWEGYTDVPGWVIDGYSTIALEAREQLAAVGAGLPTLVPAQIGVGALAAALVRGFPEARIVGVEPVTASCVQASVEAGEPVTTGGEAETVMAGLNCGTPSPLAWPTMRDGIAVLATVTEADAEEAMRALAEAGIESGGSGAAGLAGLLAHAEPVGLRPDDRVLVVSTEGATDPASYARIVGNSSR